MKTKSKKLRKYHRRTRNKPKQKKYISKSSLEEFKKLIRNARNNPIDFVEKFYGVKLFWYQKAMLKLCMSKDRFIKKVTNKTINML